MSYQKRLLRAIPGGAHTYSRGFDQFPSNAPEILSRGKGAYVFDADGNRYLDYGMALRAVNIGYAENEIDAAAIEQIRNGNNLTRPSLIELEAAELLIDMIDSVDMVKFTKNGSSSVSAAVKLARAYTGRDKVARCAQHPFFSYDDWFIGSTTLTKGIPDSTIELTKVFNYNDIESLKNLIEKHPNQFACVVLEPAAGTECPSIEGSSAGGCCGQKICSRSVEKAGQNNFLYQVQELCRSNGIVFILDEMITGFRWHMKGAQYLYGINPDLCTFGKGMANGFSVSCVAGRREIMEQGSIEHAGKERLFLLSTTHGAEMSGLGAFVKTIEVMQRENVVDHVWDYGHKLKKIMNKIARELGIEKNFVVSGPSCSPVYSTLNNDGINSLELRTLFSQEMIKNGVLMPWITLCLRHTEEELLITEKALHASLLVYRKALERGVDNFLEGPAIKPVFRKYN
ncbi:glutamate-1-semialdehyde 2,1-aminomutase [bacterium]|jgi:glutamate-1-semialdehyde 2,1-aminomutase|nr:glutamate-1-semialdehyde 2,1-aminomutase [bacterium]